jgi:hypothetical protein
MKMNLNVKILSHKKLLVKGKFHGIFWLIKTINLSSNKITVRFKINDILENAEQKQKNLLSKSCSKVIILAHWKSHFGTENKVFNGPKWLLCYNF